MLAPGSPHPVKAPTTRIKPPASRAAYLVDAAHMAVADAGTMFPSPTSPPTNTSNLPPPRAAYLVDVVHLAVADTGCQLPDL
eukprot:1160624-Pelagomonas_calceolata.AAC.1